MSNNTGGSRLNTINSSLLNYANKTVVQDPSTTLNVLEQHNSKLEHARSWMMLNAMLISDELQ